MTRRGAHAAAVTVLAVAALGSACGGSEAGAGSAAKEQTLTIRLTDDGCDPASAKVAAGAVTFSVENGGTAKVTELELLNSDGSILGEAENVVEGVPGSFSLKLAPGTYTLACPNGSSAEEGVLRVTGEASGGATEPESRLLADATVGYREYVEHETEELVEGTREFVAAIEAGDLARAKELYGPVRAHYEAIEPVAETFGDLDPAIDARVNDVASGATWTGFHRIEHSLWVRGTTDGTARYAHKLLADVSTLQERAESLEVQPAQLANGAVELLNEVASSKITGEEDRYSHTDLSDFAANLAGAGRVRPAEAGARRAGRRPVGGDDHAAVRRREALARRLPAEHAARLCPLRRAERRRPPPAGPERRRARRAPLHGGRQGHGVAGWRVAASPVVRRFESAAVAPWGWRSQGVGTPRRATGQGSLEPETRCRSTASTRPGSPPRFRIG